MLSRIDMNRNFAIGLDDLASVRQRLPLIQEQDLVPLSVFDEMRPFEKVTPQIAHDLGGKALHLAIGKPFGFVEGKHRTGSQKTEGLMFLQKDRRKGAWDVVVDTPDPLSDVDVDLFRYGIQMYVSFAGDKVFGRSSTP